MSSEQDHLKETDTEARFEFKKEENAAVRSEKGLTEEVIRMISEDKDEPDWMLERRLRALEQYQNMPMPTDWPGQPDLTELDIEEIIPISARTSTSAKASTTGRNCPTRSKTPSTNWAFRKPRRTPSRASVPSTSPKSSTRTCKSSGRRRAWSS